MIDPLPARVSLDGSGKPFQQSLQAFAGARTQRERGLEQEIGWLRHQWSARFACHNFLSKNLGVRGLFEVIEVLGAMPVPVLIEGETGVGKQQVARAIHEASVNHAGAFIAVNCAMEPGLVLDRGVEQARRGTLFLAEVGTLPFALQAEVVSWLRQSRGGDFRLIAGSSKPLQRLARQGAVIEELWSCLSEVRVEVPPLRQRPEDIRLLAEHFVSKYTPPGKPVPRITPAAMQRLFNYRWPRNVRELEAVIQHACREARGTITEQDLPAEVAREPESSGYDVTLELPLPQLLRLTLAAIERQYLRKALRRTHGNVLQTARLCGLSRRSVTAKIAEYGINRLAFKEA